MSNTLAAELILDISKFRRGIRDAQNAVNKAFKGSGMGAGAGQNLALGIAKSGAMITAALVAVVATAAGIAAYHAGKIIAQGIAMAGEHEKLQMRFEILTGSRGAGNRALNELREDAIRTGITVEDMADNVSKFIAFGFNPDEAMKLNKGILDVGGAVGLSTRDMKLLGVALSQVAAKGTANMEELRQQIAEKGIPIFKALEQQLGVTGAELSQMIQEGKVGADVVLDMFSKVPDGEGPFARFQGGAEKMASTLPGIVSRMKVVWQEFLRVLGNPIIDALKPAMEAALRAMQGILPLAAKWGQWIADAVSNITAIGMVLASISWDQYGYLFQTAFMLAIKGIANFLWAALQGVAAGFQAYMIEGWKAMVDMFKIIMRPGFWADLLFVLINVAGEFISKLFDGVVYISKYLGENLGKILTGRDIAPPELPNGEAPKSDLEELIAVTVSGVENALESAREAFEKAYKGSTEPFDTKKEKDGLGMNLEWMARRFKELSEKLKAEQRAATKERNRTDGEANPMMGGGAAGDGNGGEGGFGLNGVMSQAINVLSGRSAFAVIAQSAARSEQIQDQTKEEIKRQSKVLENIEKNTRPTNMGPTAPSAGAIRFG